MLQRSHVVWVVASVVGVLSLGAVVTLVALWLVVLTPFEDYAVVVDAGSTHSKIFVYKWLADKSDGLGTTSRINQVKACDVSGGAISSVNPPTQANVKTYFDAAMTDCISAIPSTRTKRTLIFLGATAGLRLLNIVNATYIDQLLSSTRDYFSSLGLLFLAPNNQVRIISGTEEGLAGWISTNMLMRQLYDKTEPMDTYGILDMGGASTQISFIAPQAARERYRMNLFNVDYDVYSHSYLCYGQEQTRIVYQGKLIQQANGSAMIDDPCLQSGFVETVSYRAVGGSPCALGRFVAPANFTSSTQVKFRGTGDYDACRLGLRGRFNKSSCAVDCSFDEVYQLSLNQSNLKFLAISAFYNVFNTLSPTVPLSVNAQQNFDFTSMNFTQLHSAIAQICRQPWSELTNPELRFRPYLCFYSIYHWTLAEYGYGMNDGNLRNFQLVKTIDSNEIGWTLGYMINQTNYLEAEYRPTRLLTRAEFIGLLITFLLLLVLSMLAIAVTIYLRWKSAR